MTKPPDKGGGGIQPSLKPGQTTMDLAWARHGVSGGSTPQPQQRPFSQIIAEETAYRNTIQLHLRKIHTQPAQTTPTNTSTTTQLPTTESPTTPYTTTKNLTFEDLGEFLFDILKINPEDCLGLDFTTGRYDSREVQLKPEVDVTPYLTTASNPFSFKNHEITIQRLLKNVTRITFRNVPMSVPDEEIIHLCKTYSTPVDGVVHREMVRLTAPAKRTVTGSTRYVDVNLNNQTHIRNYFWLEGPLPGDAGRRITVLYNGQPQQCSYCLKLASHGCPGGGNGKICESLGTTRAKMSVYMDCLKLQDGYVSLKSRYLEQQARSFPALGKKPGDLDTKQQANNIDDIDTLDDSDEAILPVSPLEERDAKINNLEKKLQDQIKDMNGIKENLTKVKAENKSMKKTSLQLTQKLNLTRKTNEIKLAEMITTGSTEDSPHLVTAYTATPCEEDFNLDIENDEITPKSDFFLKSVEERCNLEDETQKERYCAIRNQVLDRVKRLMTSSPTRGSRRASISSTSSLKRDWDDSDNESSEKLPSTKARVKSPIKTE